MIASSFNYIESDFSHAAETLFEYRDRTAAPRPNGAIRRAYRRFMSVR
jgi:hypothetical protein